MDKFGRTLQQSARVLGWYRHLTLALLAHAFLVVTRGQAQATNGDEATGGTPA